VLYPLDAAGPPHAARWYNRAMSSGKPHNRPGGGHSRHEAPPHYVECPACGYISSDLNFADPSVRCPKCGAPGDGRRTFPADRIRRVDKRIRRYHLEGEHEVVVILVATFLETLLEDMLARIMAAEGASVKLRAGVLDTQRSVGQRVGKLYPTLTGEQFEESSAKAGFPEFPRQWRALRTERNAFIHDAAFDGQRESLSVETAEEALDLLDQAYSLFVHINNRFVAGDKHRRHTDEPRA
jgi:hypothetical protein